MQASNSDCSNCSSCYNETNEESLKLLQGNNLYIIDLLTIEKEKPVKAPGKGIIERGTIKRRIVMKRLSEESIKNLKEQ
ncbi:8840_t:CDS:1, partial [Racocetra persica]